MLALGTDDAGELVLGLVLCAVLVAITLTDLELRIIPNAFVLAGAIAGVAIVLGFDSATSTSARSRSRSPAARSLLIALVYPRGMGMGDAKLVAMMAIYLGRSIAPAVLVGLDRRRGGRRRRSSPATAPRARKHAVPFGPFLALGGVVGLWFGDDIVDWYLDTFTG